MKLGYVFPLDASRVSALAYTSLTPSLSHSLSTSLFLPPEFTCFTYRTQVHLGSLFICYANFCHSSGLHRCSFLLLLLLILCFACSCHISLISWSLDLNTHKFSTAFSRSVFLSLALSVYLHFANRVAAYTLCERGGYFVGILDCLSDSIRQRELLFQKVLSWKKAIKFTCSISCSSLSPQLPRACLSLAHPTNS